MIVLPHAWLHCTNAIIIAVGRDRMVAVPNEISEMKDNAPGENVIGVLVARHPKTNWTIRAVLGLYLFHGFGVSMVAAKTGRNVSRDCEFGPIWLLQGNG